MRSFYNRKLSAKALELQAVIEDECYKHGGECNSLFHTAVTVAGHEYHAAYNRLRCLNRKGLVTVTHNGSGKRITVRVCASINQLTLEEAQ